MQHSKNKIESEDKKRYTTKDLLSYSSTYTHIWISNLDNNKRRSKKLKEQK
jgi:hypothetical protein